MAVASTTELTPGVDEKGIPMSRTRSNFRREILARAAQATLLGAILAFLGCGPSVVQHPLGPSDGAELTDSQADIVSIEFADMDYQIDVPASVEGLEKADLKSRLEAYVGEVLVDIGDEVKKGQLLARLDVPEMEAEVERLEQMVAKALADADTRRAELKQAEARRAKQEAMLRLRQTELQTISGLVQGGALTREQQDEAQYSVDSAAAEMQTVEADIAAAKALVTAGAADVDVARAEVQKAKSLMNYLEIIAPFDGLITGRYVDPGELVRPGTDSESMLFTIENVSTVRVVLHLPMDADAAKLDQGDQAVLHGISRRPNETFAGEITRFAKSFDHVSRMMRVEMDLSNPIQESTNTPLLHSGDYGTVTITLQTFKSIAAVPEEAVAEDDTGTYIMAIDGENKCQRYDVVRQARDAGRVGITGTSGEKLAATRVIAKNVQNYKEGDSVNVGN